MTTTPDKSSNPIPDNASEVDVGTYMEGRVVDQLNYYEKVANRAKRSYIWIQSAVIVIAVLVPVSVNVQIEPISEAGMQLISTILSVTLAVLSGLLSFRKWGDLWLSYRMTEEMLKRERFCFLGGAGSYKSAEDPFPLFVERIEAIVSTEHQKFRSFIEEARRPAKQKDG